jgi:hypothetical protein
VSKKQNVKPRAALSENKVALKTKPLIPEKTANWVYIGITILFLGIIWFARTNLLSLPFERDEGSYSYMGQLLLEGQKPYIDFYEMKLPGIFYCYAAIVGIFGKTQESMHLGFAVVTFVSTFFIWLISKKIFNTPAAMAAAISFAILSLMKAVSGFAAQAEHFVVLFSVIGLYSTILAIENGKIWHYFLAGLSLGMALLVKQSGGFFALAAGVLVILANIKPLNILNLVKSGVVMLLGFVAVVGVFVGLVASKGAYNEMLFWTIDAAKNYVGALTWDQGMQQLSGAIKSITNGYIGFWVLGFLGMTLIWLTNLEMYKKLGVTLLALIAFGSTAPGLRFYGHYFIQFMPALAILVGAAVYSIGNILKEKMNVSSGFGASTAAFLLVAITAVANQSDYYFSPSEFKVIREVYGDNPFIESDAISDYIKTHSKENGPIAVFGAEPQVYFQTQRKCPHHHSFISFTSPNTALGKAWREEVKAGVEQTSPEYVVIFFHQFSWSYKPDDDQDLFKYGYDYVKKNNYDLVGVADIASNTKPILVWEMAAQTYKPQGKSYVQLFRKKI